MKTIIPTIITVEVMALLGYYIGRFLFPFLINRFTIKFILSFSKISKEMFNDWTNFRIVQNFSSAGAGLLSAIMVGLANILFNMSIPPLLWFFTSLIIVWFSVANGVTGRIRCGVISFLFFWIGFILT